MTRLLMVGLATLALAPGSFQSATHRCDWTAPVTSQAVVVASPEELRRAVARAEAGTTILLKDGHYQLEAPIDIKTPGTVLRGQSGDRSRVVIRGRGMRDRVGVALSISAADVVIADLTIRDVAHHGIQVRGERQASRVVVHNVHIIDAGQQLLKASAGSGPAYADDGLIACSRFEYLDTAPSDYTDGVDLLAVRGWVIRDNAFVRIRGPEELGFKAGPAILVWNNSQNTLIERNFIVDSFRGIAIGLMPGTSRRAIEGNRQVDHHSGLVRNNVICNLEPWADEAIEANLSTDFRIEHNSILTAGRAVTWSIGIRFPESSGMVRNNLTSAPVLLRDGASAHQQANVTAAQPDWFEDASVCDLHLTAAAESAIDAAEPTNDRRLDFDGQSPMGPPDIGAFEFKGRSRARPEPANE